MKSLIKLLENNNISYSFIEGDYDDIANKKEENSFKKDVDIVLCGDKNKILNILLSSKNLYFVDNIFRDIRTNMRIDIYYNTINVGYYHYLIIKESSYALGKISKEEYFIYQLIDPLLKFSKYHKRHQYNLIEYTSNYNIEYIFPELRKLIGSFLAKRLISKIIRKDFSLSFLFVKLCKLRLLLINGNFVRMINKRMLGKCL